MIYILFLVSSISVTPHAKQLADVQLLELEDGLWDRIVNKIIRDQSGYFYLFIDQEIRQYNGLNFMNANSDPTISSALDQLEDPIHSSNDFSESLGISLKRDYTRILIDSRIFTISLILFTEVEITFDYDE